jgi:ribosomal protein S18 acetylase RimI-like enzyme
MNEQPARPDIQVRQLAVDDWQEARAARLMALADAPYAFSSTLAAEQAYKDGLWRRRAGSGRTFGAFDGARIIGVATGIPVDELDVRGTSDPGSAGAGSAGAGSPDTASSDAAAASDGRDGAQPEWHLVGMWVAPEYRGQGVADSLVVAVCERARAASAVTVTLWVTEMNDRAIALYRRHGFAPNGIRQLVRPEEPDHWEMQLSCPLR